ncbi:MAG: penicillin-binding transpeptidase domain-containing protein [Patescibacteria group bacterium]
MGYRVNYFNDWIGPIFAFATYGIIGQMLSILRRILKLKSSRKILDPDEIFLDSRNLPSFNTQQFEGIIEKPIDKNSLILAGLVFLLIGLIFIFRIGFLQVIQGDGFALRSNQNRLRHTLVFADRGIIYDRNGVSLAWNDPNRKYINKEGFAHILGYIGFPNKLELKEKDFDPKEYMGKSGVENTFNDILMGEKGVKIEELNALGKIESDHVLKVARPGESVTISIDSRVQAEAYRIIKEIASEHGFTGAAAAIMDIKTGEMLALVSYPEFDSNIMASGKNRQAINKFLTDKGNLFLNRPVSGLYTPGSTIKPYIGLAALAENLISPSKIIVSTGRLVVPNPYFPDKPSIFLDNKVHGAVDMRRALAVSSNVYFYTIGGGFGDQPGLGIKLIDKYSGLFGFGVPTGIELNNEGAGVVPSPDWKKKVFSDEPWRLGDTYHTAIGQYGYLVTPLQIARAVATIASDGQVLRPTLVARPKTPKILRAMDVPAEDFEVIKEGMRQTVTGGTGIVLNTPNVNVAAKSGTAQVASKSRINAWISGFFPYENPRYAFVVVMESGPLTTNAGGGMVMRRLVDWMAIYTPEYLR